jgi:hypothetical protein
MVIHRTINGDKYYVYAWHKERKQSRFVRFVDFICPPPDIKPGGRYHLAWVDSAVYNRKLQIFNFKEYANYERSGTAEL